MLATNSRNTFSFIGNKWDWKEWSAIIAIVK